MFGLPVWFIVITVVVCIAGSYSKVSTGKYGAGDLLLLVGAIYAGYTVSWFSAVVCYVVTVLLQGALTAMMENA